MASKQTEELNKLYLEWVAALKANPEMPLDEVRPCFSPVRAMSGLVAPRCFSPVRAMSGLVAA
jgi:hypothetical protein